LIRFAGVGARRACPELVEKRNPKRKPKDLLTKLPNYQLPLGLHNQCYRKTVQLWKRNDRRRGLTSDDRVIDNSPATNQPDPVFWPMAKSKQRSNHCPQIIGIVPFVYVTLVTFADGNDSWPLSALMG
jgi:hypothetical protein